MASGGHLGYVRGPHIAKIHAELDSSHQKISNITYCTTFSDNYLEKLGSDLKTYLLMRW